RWRRCSSCALPAGCGLPPAAPSPRWRAREPPMTARLLAACCACASWLLLCLWAWRQARRRAAQAAGAARELRAPAGDAVMVGHASQTGEAEALAGQTAESLRLGGLQARVAALGQLDLHALRAYPRLLVVAST